jgi:hypothetical protein
MMTFTLFLGYVLMIGGGIGIVYFFWDGWNIYRQTKRKIAEYGEKSRARSARRLL